VGLHGVDIASYQGQPSSWRDAAGDLAWAAVKLTELEPGGYEYTDPDAAADWAYLGEHGLGRIAYLFAHPSVSAMDSVNLFTEALDRVGLADTDGVALDFEVTDGCSAAATAAWAADVLGLMKRALGRTPVLYTFLAFAHAGNCAGLEGYPLWIADPSSAPGHPRVPAPWGTWAIHQYSITGQVDQDVTVWATTAEMAAAIGKPTAPVAAPVFTREDDGMLIPLPPGERVGFAPWPALEEGQEAPYKHVSMMLAGDTGATVEVTFWRGEHTATQTHALTSGESVDVAPAHKWPGVTAVTLLRADTGTAVSASATVSRW
jgi:lysozyme